MGCTMGGVRLTWGLGKTVYMRTFFLAFVDSRSPASSDCPTSVETSAFASSSLFRFRDWMGPDLMMGNLSMPSLSAWPFRKLGRPLLGIKNSTHQALRQKIRLVERYGDLMSKGPLGGRLSFTSSSMGPARHLPKQTYIESRCKWHANNTSTYRILIG